MSYLVCNHLAEKERVADIHCVLAIVLKSVFCVSSLRCHRLVYGL